MLAISTILFGKSPFLNVSTTGTILAETGVKMSKSIGNFPDPHIIIDKYGVDALRFYLLGSPVMEAEDINFSQKSVEEVYKKVLLLLYNVNNFYSINRGEGKLGKKKSNNVLDKWIVSRLNELKSEVSVNLDNYNTAECCREIVKFVDDLSTWYLRRSRERFNSEEAETARDILGNVLLETSKIIAPLLPFSAEIIYQNVTGKNQSVHLENWPNVNKNKIDKKLNEEMEKVRNVVSLILKERDVSKIPVRQPLSLVIVRGFKLNEELTKIIADEVNVKKVIFEKADEISVELDKKITPELEAEGLSRELVRKIQDERKKRGLKKGEEINLILSIGDIVKKMLEKHFDFIKEKTNSKVVKFVDKLDGVEIRIKEYSFTFNFL